MMEAVLINSATILATVLIHYETFKWLGSFVPRLDMHRMRLFLIVCVASASRRPRPPLFRCVPTRVRTSARGRA